MEPAIKPIRLPAPAMPLLVEHDEYSMAHLIERHINFYEEDKDGNRRSVALDPVFVRHYLNYRDSKLPVCTSIATLPIVLPDGELLATRGLDRERGILFMIEPALLDIMPTAADYARPEIVARAMHFLADVWLCDVAASYAGKCALIAAALTIIERALLAERPAFFVTAGQARAGKTTTIQMLFLAATGYPAPAAAWSTIEEERRKCLFSYLGEGVPAVVWDNIPRGTLISCPSIEKSLTSPTYSDRVLGKTGTRTVPSTTINIFTGNNIAPRGDMSSRSLQIRLALDMLDPENRKFRHSNAKAWTINHRGNILAALYTILLGNPRLQQKKRPQAQTRFKGWWHLVGSAVEHAAALHVKHAAEFRVASDATETTCPPEAFAFRDLFHGGEETDQEANSLATVLTDFRTRWPNGTNSSSVSAYLSEGATSALQFKAALEDATGGKPIMVITAVALTWRLKAVCDAPVAVDKQTLVLKFKPDAGGNGGVFSVQTLTQCQA